MCANDYFFHSIPENVDIIDFILFCITIFFLAQMTLFFDQSYENVLLQLMPLVITLCTTFTFFVEKKEYGRRLKIILLLMKMKQKNLFAFKNFEIIIIFFFLQFICFEKIQLKHTILSMTLTCITRQTLYYFASPTCFLICFFHLFGIPKTNFKI